MVISDREQDDLDDIIYNKTYGLKSMSYANIQIINRMENLMDSLINNNAECIILACTELPLAISDKFYKDKEIINPIDLLSKSMINSVNM